MILVGNGFDLAHNFPTRYKEFINWYWTDIGRRLMNSDKLEEEDPLCSFRLHQSVCSSSWRNVPAYYWEDNVSEEEFINRAKADKKLCDFQIKSIFLQEILKAIEDKGWVDIENEYYRLLNRVYIDNPKDINDELRYIKSKLIEYLNEVQGISTVKINPNILSQILEPIHKREIANESLQSWYDMMEERLDYPDNEWDELLKGYNVDPLNPQFTVDLIHRVKKNIIADKNERGIKQIEDENYSRPFFFPDNIMILDFNYTNTTDQYLPKSNRFLINHIHGKLPEPSSIIFGYGDELDDEFKKLVNKNDSECLHYIKSFRYLEALNYRKMLSFVESAPYQLCIMGHSCGTSDRTLLSTLFEHKNCVSIKPYYFCKENGTDNYIDLIQNISRSFNNPRIMRDRVVSKPLCEELGKGKK